MSLKQLAVVSFIVLCPQISVAREKPLQANIPKHACPSTNFQVFLKHFRENVPIQKQFSQYPVRHEYYNDSPDATIEMQTASQVDFPVIASAKRKRDHGYLTKFEKKANTVNIIADYQNGTDDKTTYTFKFQQRCWYLTKVVHGA